MNNLPELTLSELPSGEIGIFHGEKPIGTAHEPSLRACMNRIAEREKNSVKFSEEDKTLTLFLDRLGMDEIETMPVGDAQRLMSAKVNSIAAREHVGYSEALARFTRGEKGKALYARCSIAATESEGE